MGRNSPLLLVSPPIILTDAPQLFVVQNAKSSVTSTKIVATINVKDAFGGDQDIPPLIVKQRIAVGENQITPTPNINHGDIVQKQGNIDGRPSTSGQE
jgi:hypothetical protein